MLQTTTIDPGSYWSGWVVAAQPPSEPGRVRRVEVSVRLNGETHRFALLVTPEGGPSPVQPDLPAASQSEAEDTLYRTQPTWLWTAPQSTGGTHEEALVRTVQ